MVKKEEQSSVADESAGVAYRTEPRAVVARSSSISCVLAHHAIDRGLECDPSEGGFMCEDHCSCEASCLHVQHSFCSYCALFIFFYKFFWNGIDSSQGPGMTTEDAFYGEICPFKYTKTTDRFVSILGAGGVEFTSWLGRETTKRPMI